MPGQPSLWIPYVEVGDVRARTEKAQSLGGTIIKDVTEVKSMGLFSIVLDPTGAAVGLWDPRTSDIMCGRWRPMMQWTEAAPAERCASAF